MGQAAGIAAAWSASTSVPMADIDTDKLIIISLGPTATVLSYDLCKEGYQAIDTGAFDVDYEWFLRKEVELGVPLDFKYVDSGKKGRKCQPLDDPEYKSQIIKEIVLN